MRPHVFLIAGNKKYGVNGPAITLGYPESQQLMIRDEHDAFTFKSQLDLIPKGLQLCNWTDEDYRRNRLSTN